MSDLMSNLTGYVPQQAYDQAWKMLTPDQEEMLRRQAIVQSASPFDLLGPGGYTAAGGLVGYGLGALAKRAPALATLDALFAQSPNRFMQALGIGGATTGIGYMKDVKRNYDNLMRRFKDGSPSDAEGQPGGYYGISR